MQKLMQHKKYFLFVLIVLVIGILGGLFYYHFLNDITKNDIIYTLKNISEYQYNGIFKYLIIMSLLLVTSFLIIGLPLSIMFFFYESFSIGFIISCYLAAFKIKGLLLVIPIILITKFIPLILIIFFLPRIINISRYVIGLVIYKKDSSIINKIIVNFKNALYILILVLIFNTIMYFITPNIFSYLVNLIK